MHAFHAGKRLIIVVSAAWLAACATTGYWIDTNQQTLVSAGMSMNDVRGAIGQPYRSTQFRTQPGPTWTYRIRGELETVFDVDFAPDGRVISTSERYEPVGANDRPAR